MQKQPKSRALAGHIGLLQDWVAGKLTTNSERLVQLPYKKDLSSFMIYMKDGYYINNHLKMCPNSSSRGGEKLMGLPI